MTNTTNNPFGPIRAEGEEGIYYTLDVGNTGVHSVFVGYSGTGRIGRRIGTATIIDGKYCFVDGHTPVYSFIAHTKGHFQEKLEMVIEQLQSNHAFPALIKPVVEEGKKYYLITFRDIPEAISQAETLEDALLMATDCLDTALEFYVEDKRQVPVASYFQAGEVAIHMSELMACKLGHAKLLR